LELKRFPVLLTHSLSPFARILWLGLLGFTVDGQLRLHVEKIAVKYGVLRLSEVFLFFPKHCTLIVADCAPLVADCALLAGFSCAKRGSVYFVFAS
jgi:hypothetical protein